MAADSPNTSNFRATDPQSIARELFDACNAFKDDSSQWQRIAVAIQSAREEIERLTRERNRQDEVTAARLEELHDIAHERDRLKMERDDWHKVADARAAEIVRLTEQRTPETATRSKDDAANDAGAAFRKRWQREPSDRGDACWIAGYMDGKEDGMRGMEAGTL